MNEGDFFTRHSTERRADDLRPDIFNGVSKEGVELAEERAEEILKLFKDSDDGTIMFIGGTSDIDRTKSTALIYGQKMKQIVEKDKNIIVCLPDEVKPIDGYTGKIEYLAQKIKENPDKKFVIDFPLFIKQFSFMGTWTDNKTGEWTDYGNELMRRNNDNDEACLRDWLENQGKIGDLEGPNPKDVAERQLEGMNRLREFVKKYIDDDKRPIIVGSVGHCWNLDALAIYLANNGEVTLEAFNEMKGMIGETEMIRLITEKDGKQFLQYGELSIPLNKE